MQVVVFLFSVIFGIYMKNIGSLSRSRRNENASNESDDLLSLDVLLLHDVLDRNFYTFSRSRLFLPNKLS